MICYPPFVMDYLWTPWRYAYVTTAGKNEGKPDGCIFCELPKLPDEAAKIVRRGQHCYIILNSFPYTSGHVMIVPFAHLDELQKLPEATAQEMMTLSQKSIAPLGWGYQFHDSDRREPRAAGGTGDYVRED